MKLVSIDDAKIALEKTDSTHDELLDLIILGLSDRIEAALNRKLEALSRVEKFQGGQTYLGLQAFPVDLTKPFTVKFNGSAMTIDDDYYVDAGNGIITLHLELPPWPPMVTEVTYTGGYSPDAEGILTNIPSGIKRACLMQTVFEFRRRKDIGLTGVNGPDGSVTKFSAFELLPEVKDLLKLYRKPCQSM